MPTSTPASDGSFRFPPLSTVPKRFRPVFLHYRHVYQQRRDQPTTREAASALGIAYKSVAVYASQLRSLGMLPRLPPGRFHSARTSAPYRNLFLSEEEWAARMSGRRFEDAVVPTEVGRKLGNIAW